MKNRNFFSKTDLALRWGVSKQLVLHWENRNSDFPSPVDTVGNGRTKIYALNDVLDYEERHGIRPKGEA